MRHPVVDEVGRQRSCCRALVLDHTDRRLDQADVALVEHQQDARLAVAAMTALALDAVVETQHGRSRAAAQDQTARFDAGLEVGEAVRGTPFVRRHRAGAQPDTSDDAEGAFAAEEQSRQIRPHRRCRAMTGANDGPIGQDDLEPDDHFVDLAVARAVLPCAATGHPSTDGCQVEALWEVADGHGTSLAEVGLQVGTERAGHHLDDARRRVDIDDTLHGGEVHDDAAECGNGRAGHTAAPSRRRHRNAVVGTGRQHCGDLCGIVSVGTPPRRAGRPRRTTTSASPAATNRGWPPRWRLPT